MIERMKKTKLQEKRRFIIRRLRELGVLPNEKEHMNDEQQEIYDKIWSFDFSYWDEVKIKNGWSGEKNIKLTEEERHLRDIKSRIRSYLRVNDVLPAYGEPLNEEQQRILDEIENNNFTYFKKFKQEKLERLKQEKLERLKIEQSKRNSERVVKQLKKTEKINKRSDLPGYTVNSLPKMVFHRLRMCQILPQLGEPLNEVQQMIMNDVNENWLGKKKSHFIIKYIEHSTPEGRLLYRMYKSHLDYGFNFNLTIEDINIPEKCPLLEIPLSTNPKDYKEQNYYTGDRIDSSKGLVKGNIQVISMLANRMKSKATESELLIFATNGLKILSNAGIE
jgi:hypothetical protein